MTVPTIDNVTSPRKAGFGFALDDQLFRLATGLGRGVRIDTAPVEAPRVDTASSPEEIVDEFGVVFARSSFAGGEGQFRAHVPGAPPDRYWDSKGVAVSPAEPGEFPEVRLAHAIDAMLPVAEQRIRLATNGTSLWVTDGNTLQRTDNPAAASPNFQTDNPHMSDGAQPVRALAVLGDDLYAALGPNGIHRKVGSTWENFNDLAAVEVWAVKGRILASDGRSLYEVVDANAPDPITTLPPGRVWTGVTDGGEAILAAADDGYVYALSENEGELVLVAQTLFTGEAPTAIGATQGVVAIGTRQGSIGRLWVGQLGNGFTLEDLQLVREWRADGTDRHPHAIVGDRTALYTAVPLAGDVDVWRYELRTRGLSRHMSIAADGPSHGLTFHDGRLWAVVDDSGAWRQSDRFVDEGWLIGPLGDFYSGSPKSWVGARLETGTLVGTKVELFYTVDPAALADPTSPAWVKVISRSHGSLGDEIALRSVTGRQLAGMVRLFADSTGESTPAVRSFAFRAFSAAGDEDVIVTLPVNISDQFERRGRARARIRGAGKRAFERLKEFEGRPALLTLYRPAERIRGLVESVEIPVPSVVTRGSVTAVAIVRVRGRRTTESGAVVGGTFGAYAWGEQAFGEAA